MTTTNKIILTAFSIGLAAAAALPAYAQTGATPTTSNTTTKIACVGAAVNARETALSTAASAQAQAMTAAYGARATALQAAYANTTTAAVKAAVKSAWSGFNTSMKSARTAWQTARNGAWKTFRTAVAACKAPVGVSDSANSSSEASGN